jgi:hypothetical protein
MARNIVNGISTRRLTSNTQKAAYRLLNANGRWLSRADLSRTVKSAAARIRDLRKDEFGAFEVECCSAVELDKQGDHRSFYYRINPNNVTRKQINTVFRIA